MKPLKIFIFENLTQAYYLKMCCGMEYMYFKEIALETCCPRQVSCSLCLVGLKEISLYGNFKQCLAACFHPEGSWESEYITSLYSTHCLYQSISQLGLTGSTVLTLKLPVYLLTIVSLLNKMMFVKLLCKL